MLGSNFLHRNTLLGRAAVSRRVSGRPETVLARSEETFCTDGIHTVVNNVGSGILMSFT